MSTIGPEMPVQPLKPPPVVTPPSCSRTTMFSTPWRSSCSTSALAVSASSRKSKPGHALGRDDRGRALERHADEGDLGVRLEALDRVRRGTAVAASLGHDVGGEELEVGAGEVVAVEAAVDRVAATLLHAQQLVGALVELVVADGVDVEADLVHGLDGRLVVEQRRQQRAGARSGRRPTPPSCCGGWWPPASATWVDRNPAPPASMPSMRPLSRPAGRGCRGSR